MDRTIKVFCTGSEQDQVAAAYPVIERYDGFILIQTPEDKARTLAKTYPIEDISDQFHLRAGEQMIDTSIPRLTAKGKTGVHPAYKGVTKLSSGPHHHLVQFIGPIKQEWLAALKKVGGEPRSPHEGFSYIVKADDQALTGIAALPFVRWVGHLSHSNRIAPSALSRVARTDTGPDTEPADLPRTRILPGSYSVDFFAAKELNAAIPAIKKLGFQVVEKDLKALLAVITDPIGGRGAAKRILDLAAIHGVRYIRERSVKRTSNDIAPRIMGATTVMGHAGLGLNGEGETIAICDTGLDTGNPQSIHPDFSGRISWIKSYPITADLSQYVRNPGGDDGPADLDSGHGTHVAGSVLGDGSASTGINEITAPIRGLAYKAKLVFQAVEQEMQWKDPAFTEKYGRYLLAGIPLDLNTLFNDAYQKNARIHSNSWGGGAAGEYDPQSEQLDKFVWEHKDFCILVACGNDGSDNDADGKINATSVTSPATAKNCITVGACESERPIFNSNTYGGGWPKDYPVAPYRNDPMADNPNQVAAFSSRGPTATKRIKPDIVAPGTYILSTRSSMIAQNNMAWGRFAPSNKYFYMGGTSMATPLAAGAVALLRQYLRNTVKIKNPSAALLKASAITGAVRLPGYGSTATVVDNDQGYGRINLDAILSPTESSSATFLDIQPGLSTGQVHSIPITITSSATPLRMTLAYSDYPGAALVNNLNLMAKSPDGKHYLGNQEIGNQEIGNQTIGNPPIAGALTLDVTNNIEVIQVDDPAPGKWVIDIVASNVPQGPQDFALVYLAATTGEASTAVVRQQAAPLLSITDNYSPGVSSSLHFSQTGSIESLKIDVDIQHSYIGDLRIELIAPDQTALFLHDRNGASTDNIIKTYDIHNTPGLVVFSGKPITGDWKLRVSDMAALDVGSLRNWGMEVTLASGNQIHLESNPFVAIPDNNRTGVSDSMEIQQSGPLRDIRVSLDITHTWIADLTVTLTGPSGLSINLHNRSGGEIDNIVKTFDTTTLPALTGLLGKDAKGIWSLQVTDTAGRDVGKLNRWSLDIKL